MKNFSFKTKRNFHRDSDTRTLGKVVLYTLIALGVVFVLRYALGNVASGSVGVLMRMREYFRDSSAALPVYIRSRNELNAEITTLNEHIAAQSGDASTIGRLTHENDELRALLGDTKDERILAGVIARPPSIPYDLLMIDRGRAHGIIEGTIVYHANNHAIGMVSRVYETTALVTLFSSAGVESTVYVYGPNVFAYAYGEGGGVMRISLPQGIHIEEGDPVVLPSLHMGDVGIVDRVVSLAAQPEQSAYLTFPVAIQSIRSVTVGREPMRAPTPDDLETGVEFLKSRLRAEIPENLRLGTGTTTSSSTTPGIPMSTTSPQ